MKILVFGGGGFIGSAIVDRLLKDRHELRIFERPRVATYRQFLDDEKVEWLTGDMSNVHDLNVAIDGIDIVIHLVSTTLPKSSNDDPIYDVQSNLVATLQLLNIMVAKHVRKIVFISSGGTVYGMPTHLPIDENHPTEPLVSYGITKLAIEKYLLMYQFLHGIKVTILRVSNPYGERQRIETAQGVVAVFLNKAIQNQPLAIWGDGRVTRDYIYIGDVAEAFACAVDYDGTKSIFNVCSGVGTSITELIAMLERVISRELVCEYLPARSYDVPVSVLDNSLARQELKWIPQINFEDGLVRTASWIQKELNK